MSIVSKMIMSNRKRLKPLYKENEFKVPKTNSFSYFMIRKFPFYLKSRKHFVTIKKYAKIITPITISIISSAIIILIIIDTGSRYPPPPNEIMGWQLNMMLMSALIVFAYLWGLGCKYRRVQIPRGWAGF